jgi:mannitol/fructose-specific phosphotransferase system IIA component (Ntr-type)
MPLRDYCSADAILPDMETAGKEDAIRQLVDVLAGKGFAKKNANAVYKEVIERERRATTGIGGGIGIPHARSAHAKKISIAIGRVKDGLDFEAVDGEQVRVVVLLISPQDSPDEHLAAMKSIVSIVRDPYQCKRLHGCTSPESFLDLIAELDGVARK